MSWRRTASFMVVDILANIWTVIRPRGSAAAPLRLGDRLIAALDRRYRRRYGSVWRAL